MATTSVALWQDAVDGIVSFIEQVGQRAEIQNVDLRAPRAGSTQSRRVFETFKIVEKMAFDTEDGSTTFDGTGIERVFEVTAYMDYIDGVTSEQMVLFNGTRFNIISVENIGEINGVLSLKLARFGSEEEKASQA